LDSNTYVVYSLGKISTNHVCPKAKTISAVQISSGQTVRINPSCYIRTMDHIITADDSEEITIHSKWLDWTWTLGQLFQQKESAVVASAIAKLRTRISGKFDAEVLLNELATMSKEAKELAKEVPFNHWIFTSPGAMIGATLVCLFILFCCWRLCRNNNAQPAPYPTAPMAPPTVYNMTVDPIRR
jgi:hypothetical protein